MKRKVNLIYQDSVGHYTADVQFCYRHKALLHAVGADHYSYDFFFEFLLRKADYTYPSHSSLTSRHQLENTCINLPTFLFITIYHYLDEKVAFTNINFLVQRQNVTLGGDSRKNMISSCS